MIRKCASIALGIALVFALSYAMAHAQPLKAHGGSVVFSAPCEPASPTIKAKCESEVISTVDSIVSAETAEALDGILRAFCVEAAGCPLAAQSALTYVPLLRRPPPLNS